jgi:hypothetical protein
MKTPKQAVAKGGQPLPKGAYGAGVPGTKAQLKVSGAPRPTPVTIDKSFVADPRGGAPLVVGKRHVEVRDNRTKNTR